MARSIKQQFNYCISKSTKTGQSKHSAKKAGTYKHGELYGNKTVEAYRDTAKNFSNWLSEHHPEIKEVREITPYHVQEWVNDRSKNWTEKTLENHLSRIKHLEEQAQRAYGKENVKFFDKEKIKKPTTKEAVRNKMMEKSDFLKLREEMSNSRSFAKDAIEITYRCGLRIDEVAHLKREDIDLNNKTIFVSGEGAKNGRERVVPIRDHDLQYFKELLDRNPENGYMCKISTDAINRAIGRSLKKVGLDEKYKHNKEHAVRKLYATERMKEERGDTPLASKKEEMKCWDKVCKELGHGAGREALYKTYCKG